MLKVGLTGGIGSGKTFVAAIFAHLGIPIFSSDIEAKSLYDTDTRLLRQLRSIFGERIFIENTLNKKALAAIVFSDSSALSMLNAFVHPALETHFHTWLSAHAKTPYIIQEAAILFESGFDKLMDKVAVVIAPEELRVKRVMERDKLSAEEVRSRMQHQLKQEELVSMTDFTIVADNVTPLLPQVLSIHNQLLKLSANGLR